MLKRALGDKRGATAMEYALILASIGGLVLAGATVWGNAVNTLYQANSTAMNGAVKSTFTP